MQPKNASTKNMNLPQFAVLQLSGCAGCEVSLLNASEWIEEFELVYMPLVVSAYEVPCVDVLLISGGVRSDEDLYNLPRVQSGMNSAAFEHLHLGTQEVRILHHQDTLMRYIEGRA